MLRFAYNLLWRLALPFLPLRLWWRGRRQPGYRTHVIERYGCYASAPRPPVLWVHAVSLGETRAAVPLIAHLRQAHPDATLLLTTVTTTGRAAGRELFGDAVVQAWLPYDAPGCVRRFLAHFRPAAGLILETELWPNLVEAAQAARVPVYLVNARLSARSARRYARVPSLARRTLASLAGVAAQAGADATRLAELGAADPIVTGNIKFDLAASAEALALGQALRARFGGGRPVWVAGSTREGEEVLILDAIARAKLPPRTLTVIVPRHPQRFDRVALLLQERGVAFMRRSAGTPVPPEIAFVLGDSMGEMLAYYAAADVVFVGGSLLPLGGQNLIEPIAVGRPTLVGPHTFNFAEASANAKAAGAALEVADADALIATVAGLLSDERRRTAIGAAALAFHAAHRGAVDRLWAWLAPRIAAALRRSPPG
jgi:3-deoxy-D-manno-octulosonic-acid transferase